MITLNTLHSCKTVATARLIPLCYTNKPQISSVCQLKVQLSYSTTSVIALSHCCRSSSDVERPVKTAVYCRTVVNKNNEVVNS